MQTVARRAVLMASAGMLVLAVSPVGAQYFGRNKVQYETFDFRVLETERFSIYHYPGERAAAETAARLAERWYNRLSRLMRHELAEKQPLVLYANHPHFEQTNVISGLVSEGTGGVTEGLKRRVVMPFAGTLAETDHVLGHELVHAFQYDLAGPGPRGLGRLPLWFVEGMAEYLSRGPHDPQTAMWMRDAVVRDDLPDLLDLNNPRYFPYRYGQAFWVWATGRWGDDLVWRLFASAVRLGDPFDALAQVTDLDLDTLSQMWTDDFVRAYGDVTGGNDGRTPGVELPRPGRQPGSIDIAPSLSPDGRRLVFLSERGLFSIEMFLADVESGTIIRKIVKTATDPHFDSLAFINSSGSWAPDGRRFVFAAIRQGKPVLAIVDVDSGSMVQEVPLPDLGEVLNPSWSPDGRAVAFSAITDGLTDLYVYDFEADALERLTRDSYADLQPTWAPDGRSLAIVTDRFTSDLDDLVFGRYQIGLVRRDTGRVEHIKTFATGKAIDPQWSSDGEALYFRADPTGITNVYRVTLASGRVDQITDVLTGVTGITALSPALSLAAAAPRLAYSVFHNRGYAIYTLDAPASVATSPSVEQDDRAMLPPPRGQDAGPVAAALVDPSGAVASDLSIQEYRPRLQLDAVGMPYLTAGADRLGAYVGGGVSFHFSDMLGRHDLGTAVQVSGEPDLIGGQVGYVNRTNRLNWGGVVERLPFRVSSFFQGYTTVDGEPAVFEQIERFSQVNHGVTALAVYPFDRSRRLEMAAGYRFITFGRDVRLMAYSRIDGRLLSDQEWSLDAPESLSIGEASVAYVYDTSLMGPTSPLVGTRYRVEVSPAFGSLNYTTVLADARHYIMPVRPFTVAGRVLHLGRYGGNADTSLIAPLFLGYPNLVRGYEHGSFTPEDCRPTAESGCPAYDQLFGSRLAVAGVELRFPLVGAFTGEIDYGVLPVEGLAFADTGVAWTASEGPRLAKAASSVGVGIRANLFGFAVVELDAVRPFDRPGRGWMFVFNFSPGY